MTMGRLCDPACGYVLALAGVVLQSVGRSDGGRVRTCSSRALHSGNTEGKPEPVKPTHRDVKLMPRLLLPFNQNREKKKKSLPIVPRLLLSLSVSGSVWLTD